MLAPHRRLCVAVFAPLRLPCPIRFFDHGADVATSATYQLSFEGLKQHVVGCVFHGQAEALFKAAVACAVAARDSFWKDHMAKVRP